MDLNTQLAERVTTESADARKLARIENSEQYQVAAEKLNALAALRKQAKDHHDPVIAAAHAAHKAALAAWKRIDEPIAEAERVVRDAMTVYVAGERRKQEEALQAALAEEAERKRIEAAEAAKLARANGATREEVAAIRQEIREAPSAVIARPMMPAAQGVATVEQFDFEVTDLSKLVEYVAKNKAHLNALVANEKYIRSLVNAQRERFAMPGVTVTKRTGIRRTGR
jgi:hypothetical protein